MGDGPTGHRTLSRLCWTYSLAHFAAVFALIPEVALVGCLPLGPLLLYATCPFAQGRGRSAAWGIVGPLGVLVLVALPPRRAAPLRAGSFDDWALRAARRALPFLPPDLPAQASARRRSDGASSEA